MATSNQICNAISVLLDDTNYPTWHFLMHHYLRGHGLLKFVDGSHACPSQVQMADHDSLSVNTGAYEKWTQQDSFVICIIATTLSADALTLVIGCQTSREVWLTLKQRYAFVSEFHIMQLKSILRTIQKGSDSIEKYLLRFKSVRDRLAAAEVTMNDQDAKILILAGLPIEYSHTRQIIRAKIDIGVEEVRSLLLSAEFELELKHKSCSFSPMYTMVPNNASCLFGTSSNPVMHNGTFGSHSMPQDNAGYVNFIGGIRYHGDYSQANNDFIQQSGRGFQSPMTIANGYQASFNIDAMMNGGSCIPHTGAFMSNRKYVSTFSKREMENKKELFSIGKGGKDRFESETIEDTAVLDTMDAYMSQPHNGVGPSLPNAQFSQQHGSFKQQKDGEISLMLNGNFNQQNGSSQVYSPVFNNSNCGFSTQNGDFAEDSIRKFSDLSHTEGHISYPNFLANEGCINRRDDFKPQFNKCKAAKQADSKVLGKPNHMTSNIQILQNVSEVSEMAGSTVSTVTKNTEKNIHVGVRPKALSATICTQQEPPAIATQANVKASHSHVFKALPVTHALPLSVPTYPHLQQSLVKGIEAFPIPNSSTPDKDMVNCKQASHPMKLWRSLFLIPPG